ncbi:MAG: dihydrodipicolinate synthase family protein [Acidimicrobiia bacterium]
MPVLVSPMNQDGSPDEPGFHRLIDHIYTDPEAPIPGLWVLGSTGENFMMSFDHRVEVTRIVCDKAGGKTALLVGCGDAVLSEVFRFFEATAHLAIDGYHCLPTDRKLSPSATIAYWTAVADRSPKPLWLYSNPARALEPDVAAVTYLSQHPNVVGMKVGGFDLRTIAPIAALNSAEFQVLGAGGSNHLAYLGLGVTCTTMSTACTLPGEFAAVHTLWSRGDLDGAREQSLRLNAFVKEWPARRNTEAAAEEKAILELLGVCQRWVYPPYEPLDDDQMEQMRKILEQHGLVATTGAPPTV